MFRVMEPDSDGTSSSLPLEPFVHQVGGHSSLLLLDKSTICKPLIAHELNFYENAPDCLKTFMPELKGIVNVTFKIDADGYLNTTAILPSKSRAHDQHTLCEETEVKYRIRVRHSGSIQIEDDSQNSKEDCFEDQSAGASPLNPWVLHCHQEQVKRIEASPAEFTQRFLMLENLTSGFEFPCILDVKMGTRNFGDDVSALKRQRRIAKAAKTTSSSLGIRICGIQKYHQDLGQYVCHNKYYGRSLTVSSFHEALYQFFHTGLELRHDVISALIDKLRKLRDIIQTLETFRFYASSLLIVYSSLKADVRDTPSCFHNGIFADTGANPSSDSKVAQSCHCHGEGHSGENSNGPLQAESQKCDIVNVRMIDFGHSIHNHTAESHNLHPGPDGGYLFGLENFIAQLKTLRENDRQRLL